MEHFSFDELTLRRHTNSYKWDLAEDDDVIPLWVADMDFPTAPAVREALLRRVEHGVFGYTLVPEAFYQSAIRWFETRHGWTVDREHILYTSGVVPAISAVIQALTSPGDSVMVSTPVYNCFFSSIRNNGCRIVEHPLVYQADSDGEFTYSIDCDSFERTIVDQNVKLFLLCNPHNPACRVWTREELEQIGEICLRHDVVVVSDEIHGELTMPGRDYVPYASLGGRFSREAVVCTSPSKAFNMAGLQIALIIADRDDWRQRIDKSININEVCDVNPFGVEALMAAYDEGAEWLDALRRYLWDNYLALKDFFRHELPELSLARLEGTYLVWVDCRHLGISSEQMEERMLKEQKVFVNAGSMYGQAGEGFIRINIACPRSRMMEGLKRIARFFHNL